MSLFKAGEVLFLNVRTIKTRSRFISDGNTCAWLAGVLLAGVVVVGAMGVTARTKTGTEEPGMTIGRPWAGERGLQKTTAEIMADPAASKPRAQFCVKGDREIPGRRNRPQNPGAMWNSQYPFPGRNANSNAPIPSAPQTIGTNFTGATLAETGSIPPDTMGGWAVAVRRPGQWKTPDFQQDNRRGGRRSQREPGHLLRFGS